MFFLTSCKCAAAWIPVMAFSLLWRFVGVGNCGPMPRYERAQTPFAPLKQEPLNHHLLAGTIPTVKVQEKDRILFGLYIALLSLFLISSLKYSPMVQYRWLSLVFLRFGPPITSGTTTVSVFSVFSISSVICWCLDSNVSLVCLNLQVMQNLCFLTFEGVYV